MYRRRYKARPFGQNTPQENVRLLHAAGRQLVAHYRALARSLAERGLLPAHARWYIRAAAALETALLDLAQSRNLKDIGVSAKRVLTSHDGRYTPALTTRALTADQIDVLLRRVLLGAVRMYPTLISRMRRAYRLLQLSLPQAGSRNSLIQLTRQTLEHYTYIQETATTLGKALAMPSEQRRLQELWRKAGIYLYRARTLAPAKPGMVRLHLLTGMDYLGDALLLLDKAAVDPDDLKARQAVAIFKHRLARLIITTNRLLRPERAL